MSDDTATWGYDVWKMDGLEAGKETLLSILRAEHVNSAPVAAFDEEATWRAIYAAAHRQTMDEALGGKPRPNPKRYEDIARALKKALALLTEEQTSETSGPMIGAWLHNQRKNVLANFPWPQLIAKGMTANDHWKIEEQSEDDPKIKLARSAKLAVVSDPSTYNAAISIVSALSDAATGALQYVRDGSHAGNPKRSELPERVVISLAEIFKESTGTIPKWQATFDTYDTSDTDDGTDLVKASVSTPFPRFVRAYLDAMGRNLADGTLRRVLNQAKKDASETQSWKVSPFA